MKSIDVVAAIIVDQNHVLATQRGYGEFKGMWEFPGGKVEPGETPEQALEREIYEELGSTISIDRHFTVVDYDYSTFHLHMDCYLCRASKADIKLKEHMDGRWVDRDTIKSLNWLPADLGIIVQLQDCVLGE